MTSQHRWARHVRVAWPEDTRELLASGQYGLRLGNCNKGKLSYSYIRSYIPLVKVIGIHYAE